MKHDVVRAYVNIKRMQMSAAAAVCQWNAIVLIFEIEFASERIRDNNVIIIIIININTREPRRGVTGVISALFRPGFYRVYKTERTAIENARAQ